MFRAQRKDRLYLTFDLQDCKDPEITVVNDESAHAGKVTFKGKAHSHATGPEEHAYLQELELYGEINQDDIKQVKTDRTVSLIIGKKEEGPHWPRLLKAAGRPPANIKVDWSRWVDEDEEEESAGLEADGFDMSALQNFGGGGGAGGMPDLSALMNGAGGAGGMPDFASMMGGGSAGLQGLGADADFGEDGDDSDEEAAMPALEKGSA